MINSKNSGGEVGKLTLTRLLTLSGQESYLASYKVTAIFLTLNLILLGAQWMAAVLLLPGARLSYAKTAGAIAIFLTVFMLWIRPSIKYHWETARELSEKNRLGTSFEVQFYRLTVSCYWQVFVGYSRLWSCLTLVSALLSVVAGCTILGLIVLAPGDDIVGIVRAARVTATWSAVTQLTYCLLARQAVKALADDG